MGTVLRIPLYTYYDSDTLNKQSSISVIMDDGLRERIKNWYTQYGNQKVFRWTGSNITDIPNKVNNAIGFPLLSKKSGQFFLPIPNDPDHPTFPAILMPHITDVFTRCYIDYQLHTGMNNPMPSKIYNPDNNANLRLYSSQQVYGRIRDRASDGVSRAYLGNYINSYSVYNDIASGHVYYNLQFYIYPEDTIIGRTFNPAYKTGGSQSGTVAYTVEIDIDTTIDGTSSLISEVAVRFNDTENVGQLMFVVDYLPNIGPSAQELDTDNPYGEGGSATVGGGDGKYGDIDAVDGTPVPDIPTLSAVDTGFISLYNPTTAQLKSLYNFLWSNQFDINTFKKLYADPMECLISLGITPCVPASSGATNIMFGNVDSGVNATELSTQFAQVDCGSVDIDKYVGSFLDYSPYVKISLFLPYIGFMHLGVDDLMGGSVNVTYNIDCLSGECVAFVSHSERGVLYSYTGNCRAELPITAQNYTGFLKNYYESLTGIIPSTISGAAGGPAGAIAGAAGGALSVAETVLLNNKPDFQRSGSCAGSAGMIGVQNPFIIIERPRFSVPNKVQKYVGQTANITMYLGDCKGFTAVEFVHLDGLNATSDEIAEIETMLAKGVIF